MRLHKMIPLLLFLLFGLLGTAAHAATALVDDQAGLFSSEVVQKATRIIEHIQRDTTPPKQVVVLTLPELPAGKEADELARSRFSERSLDGVLVLVVKKPHKLALSIGRETEVGFTRSDGEAMRKAMLGGFAANKYDEGLLSGLHVAETRLLRAFPLTSPSRAARAQERSAGGGYNMAPRGETAQRSAEGFPWIWVLGIGGVLFIGYLGVRALGRSGSGSGPTRFGGGGYVGGPSGVPGATGPMAGGGGLGRSILGGIAGAAAGSWLYDRFARDHTGDNSSLPSAHADPGSHRDDVDMDNGSVGTTIGGSGGGDDWGGGGGGDFGGGGDGGGGDW